MSLLGSLGLRGVRPLPAPTDATRYLMVQHPLRRVLAFRGRSIDDVVNNPIVKNEILGYWKLQNEITRRGEIVDLERQWNPLGR